MAHASSTRSSPASRSPSKQFNPTAARSSSATSQRPSPNCGSPTTSTAPTTPRATAASNARSVPTTTSSTTSAICPLTSAGSRLPCSPGTAATSPGGYTRLSATSHRTDSTSNGCPNNPNERRRCPICLDPAQPGDAGTTLPV